MNLSPLLEASFAIKLHVATVVPAAFLGAWLLTAPKGTALHRVMGRVWLLLMVGSALSSFFIHEINLFYGMSPIHLLSVYVLYGSVQAISKARSGEIRAHRRIVRTLYLAGILGAGVFTLLPGRIMNRVVLAPGYASSIQGAALGVLGVCILFTVLFAVTRYLPRRPPSGTR